jgi:hypothetical protein
MRRSRRTTLLCLAAAIATLATTACMPKSIPSATRSAAPARTANPCRPNVMLLFTYEVKHGKAGFTKAQAFQLNNSLTPEIGAAYYGAKFTGLQLLWEPGHFLATSALAPADGPDGSVQYKIGPNDQHGMSISPPLTGTMKMVQVYGTDPDPQQPDGPNLGGKACE